MPTSVFISYSHDSDAHREFVRGIADRLRADGFNCQIDQYINGFPPEGWLRWMEMQVEKADFVLLVCTGTYLKRYRGQDADGGRGVSFEGVVIAQTLYDAYYQNTKFIPVIPDAGNLAYVPLPLKCYSTYRLPAGYDELRCLLTGQHATPAPEVGTVKYLPSKESGGLALHVDLENETIEAASYTMLPVAAVKAKLNELQAELHNEKRTNNNLNDLINRYQDEIQEWKEKYEEALEQNTEDLRKEPNNPLLLAEHTALEEGDFELTAELRESYYRKQLKDKRTEQQARLQAFEQQLADENRALSREAFIAGDRWESANNLSKALPLYQEAVEIDPDNREAWRKITFAAKKLGKTQLALKAARSFKKHLDPEKDTKWLLTGLNDEGDLLTSIGDNKSALDRYRQSMQLTLKLVEAEPENTDWQRDLSVSFEREGDMHKARGDNALALKAYEDSLEIRNTLVQLDPKRVEWQRDLSVIHIKVGEIYKANGDDIFAFNAYADSMVIAKILTELDPKHSGWQRDLSVCYNLLGDMNKASGDGEFALKAYEDGLAITGSLVKLDPKNTEWQNDLSMSYERIGDTQKVLGDSEAAMAAYQSKLIIDLSLVGIDPCQTKWQRDLSISHERIGDIHKVNGDIVLALRAYEESLVIWEKLKKLDQNNIDWQRGSTIPRDRIGDIHRTNGDVMAALKAYEESLAIRKALVDLNPENVVWQTDVVLSFYNLAQVQPEKAEELLSDALAILTRLNSENRLDHKKQGWIPILEDALTQSQKN